MKRFLLLLSCLLLTVSLTAQSSHGETRSYEPLKVGLVLGGGGAKGAATIQILTEIDAMGIPIHCVVGTSIGALVGGLYAYGYTPDQIETIYNKTAASEILSWVLYGKLASLSIVQDVMDFFGVEQEDDALEMLKGYVGSRTTFGDTHIPFYCVATDMDHDMKPVVMGEDPNDNLALAMRASMSVPLAFPRIQWHGHNLSDGGLCNNLPVDVAREMGAEVVIAIDLEQEGEDLPWFLNILPWFRNGIKLDSILEHFDYSLEGEAEELIDWLDLRPDIDSHERNRADADYYFNPDLLGYDMASFRDRDKKAMMERGRTAVEGFEHWEGISRLGEAYSDPHLELINQMVVACGEGLSLSLHSHEGASRRDSDKEAEFAAFLNATYTKPEYGRDDAAYWMGYFTARGDRKRAADCKNILKYFQGMMFFFNGYFPSEHSYDSQLRCIETRFSNSGYPVVLYSWIHLSSTALYIDGNAVFPEPAERTM